MLLELGGDPGDLLGGALHTLPLVFVIYMPACWLFGLYRGIWRYAGMMDLRRIIMAVAAAAVVVAAAIYMFQLGSVPRSVP